jgi:hypothetical protein
VPGQGCAFVPDICELLGEIAHESPAKERGVSVGRHGSGDARLDWMASLVGGKALDGWCLRQDFKSWRRLWAGMVWFATMVLRPGNDVDGGGGAAWCAGTFRGCAAQPLPDI